MSFDDFWNRYPRRVAKGEARKAWAKLNPTPALEADIDAALEWQCRQWAEGELRYVPHPATYLRQERWSDEPPEQKPRGYRPMAQPTYGSFGWKDECERLHAGRCGNSIFHAARMADDEEQVS